MCVCVGGGDQGVGNVSKTAPIFAATEQKSCCIQLQLLNGPDITILVH